MRSRVLVPILACVLFIVVAIAVPALQAISSERTQDLVLRRSSSLARFAGLARAAVDSGDATSLAEHGRRYVELYDEPVLVIDPSGRAILDSTALNVDHADVALVATAAKRNQPVDTLPVLYPWSERFYLMAQPVVGIGDLTGGAVITRVDAGRAIADLRGRWALAIALAALGFAILTALAFGIGRWILRPVRELDEASRALAEGRMPPHLGRTGPPELRRLAVSFDEMAGAVTGIIRERGRLVEDFSHRLRNPLAALRLRVDYLDSAQDEGTRSQTMHQVNADLDRLEAMVDTMLDLADAEHRAGAESVSGLLPPEDRPLRMSCEFFPEEAVARWKTGARERGVNLSRTGADHVTLACTAMDVHDIVDEFVENALKYSGPGSDVVLDLRLPVTLGGGDQTVAVITVSDTGPGIDEADLARAGERFWRGSAARHTEGTGLGLSIVHQLARANGGSVRLSHNDPRGLVVRAILPVAVTR